MFWKKKEECETINIDLVRAPEEIKSEHAEIPIPTSISDPEPQEEWIWVEGYKGVNGDLTGHDKFKFEINKMVSVEGKVEKCNNGFHLCRRLKDVFNYYNPIKRNSMRIFKVKALVRKNEWEELPITDEDQYKTEPKRGYYGYYEDPIDKIAAKSIELIEEISIEEVFQAYIKICDIGIIIDHMDLAKEFYVGSQLLGIDSLQEFKKFILTTKYHYSSEMSNYILTKNKLDVAIAFGAENSLTMYEKLNFIFNIIK